MAINYTTLEIQLAGGLKALRKRMALILNARDAATATYDRRLYTAANGLSTSDNQEAAVYAGLVAHLASEVQNLYALYRRHRDATFSLKDGLGKIIAEDLALSGAERSASPIRYEYDPRNIDGTVAILRRHGILGALYHDMVTQSKSVTASSVSVGTFTAGAGNVGTLTDTSLAGKQHVRPGVGRIECVSESVSRPQFRVTNTYTLPKATGEESARGDNVLTAEKAWEDGPTGLAMTLTRTGLASPTETDASSLIASSTITNPQDVDSNHGIFYFKITHQTGDVWLIEVYSDSARTNKVGVCSPSPSGTSGTTAISITCVGGTVIATTFSKANANTAMPNVGDSNSATQLDIKSPRLGDFWEVTITNDGAGDANERLAEAFAAELPTSGSPTFTDSNFDEVSIS